MRQRSCGLLVESPAGWLLAHATGTQRWDLPKGRMEAGETPLQAALRECVEETGLDFACHAAIMEDLGCHAYLPHKDLHLFRLVLPTVLDLSGCKCTTYAYRRHGDPVLETDAYAWVPANELPERVGRSLVNYLQARALLPASPLA